MATITLDTDTLIHVIQTVPTKLVGSNSPFSTKPHPGTNEKIEGWKWDERPWPTQDDIEHSAIVPTLWDPDLSSIPESWFQSGIGDGNDLLMVDTQEYYPSGLPINWAPVLNHGHYYTHDQGWYLYSDQYQSEYTVSGLTVSGQQYNDLKYFPRAIVPVTVRQYHFDRAKAKYTVELDFRSRTTFTTSGTEPEFKLDFDYTPPRLFLSSGYSLEVCSPLGLTSSGTASAADVQQLEYLGVSNGEANQEFNTLFSPIDDTQGIQVWTYSNPTVPSAWTIISGYNEFTLSGQQVIVDRQLGTVTFGSYDTTLGTGLGLIPPAGHVVAAYYTKTVEILYEPSDIARDFIVASTANINPITTGKNVGFVQVTTKQADEPASVTLSAELDFTQPNIYDIEIGNNSGILRALVRAKDGTPIEGISVTFELQEPAVGSFSGDSLTTTAITNGDGIASAFYKPPAIVGDAGAVTNDVTVSGSQTIMNVPGLGLPTNVSGVYTYNVLREDFVLGIHQDELDDYYTDFFSIEHIDDDTALQSWEENYRGNNLLTEPTTYTTTDLRTGAKRILLTTREIMHPHTGAVPVSGLAPLHPISATSIGTSEEPETQLLFNAILDEPSNPTSPTKSYMVVGDVRTPVFAWVQRRASGQKIYSNTIILRSTLSDQMNGTFYADTLSDIPSGLLLTTTDTATLSDAWILTKSGELNNEYYLDKLSGEDFFTWFKRTQKGASNVLGLAAVTPSGAPAEIPIGFRLKSAGITVASVLDAVTYIGPNDLVASGYYNTTNWYTILT